MRLIDADKVKDGIRYIDIESYKVLPGSTIQNALLTLVDTIKTVDATPVRHGQWTEKEVSEEPNIIDSWQSAKCTVCNRYHTTPYSYYFMDYKYCPHCGSIMDGGEHDATD